MYFSEKILIQKKAAGSLLKIRMNFLTIRHCFPSFLRGKIINRIHRKKFGLFSRFRKWYELEEKSILSPKLISFFTEDQLIFSISLFVITTRIYHKNPDTLAIPFGLYLQLHSFFFFSAQHSETFPIQNIWILPSHILVLSGKSKQQLLAYDQYHKIGLSSSPSSDVPDLLSLLNEQKGM